MASVPALAGEEGRLYDTQGRFSGTYRESSNGAIRVYGRNNDYLASMYPSRSGGYRIYGNRGEYQGSTYEKPKSRGDE